MGNQPPSNGTSRDDHHHHHHHPQGVIPPVMGPNGQTTHQHKQPSQPQNQQAHYQQQPFPSRIHQQQQQQQAPSHLGVPGGYTNHGQAMHPSNSDASMSNVDDGMNRSIDPNNAHNNDNDNNNGDPSVNANDAATKQQNFQLTLASLAAADDDTVPTVFRWEHGGRQVYITGTFNGWSRQIPMHRSGNDFTYIHNLKRGKHAFKFIVDDEWRFAPDQPTVSDIEGRINNFIDVTDFKAYTGDKDFERERAAAYYSQSRSPPEQEGSDGAGAAVGANAKVDGDGTAMDTFTDPDGEVFTHSMPDLDDYTKDPPPLPPHLRHIILNKPPQLSDTAALPVPQHVALNHLYCTAIKDNMMVLGVTQRFRTKFVTTVYYSPELRKT